MFRFTKMVIYLDLNNANLLSDENVLVLRIVTAIAFQFTLQSFLNITHKQIKIKANSVSFVNLT